MRLIESLTWSTVALLVGCAGASHHQANAAPASEAGADIVRIRKATRPFQSLDRAVKAGYAAQVNACIAHPRHGVMGFHHANRALLDDKLEIDHPEILVYERMADSSYVLNGVEYIVPFTVHPREKAPPVILGQQLKPANELGLWTQITF